MRYLLDTNIVSDLVRNPNGRITARLAEVGEKNVATSAIVAAELRYGAAKKNSARLTARLDAVLGAIEVLAFEQAADEAYGSIRASLEQRGEIIGANDLLIAAQAVAGDMVLVTDSAREFARVTDLKTENWLR